MSEAEVLKQELAKALAEADKINRRIDIILARLQVLGEAESFSDDDYGRGASGNNQKTG